jgi:hypothetical protein
MKRHYIISCFSVLMIPYGIVAQVKTDSVSDSHGIRPPADAVAIQVNSQIYDWRQSPDSNLSAPGAHTVALSSCRKEYQARTKFITYAVLLISPSMYQALALPRRPQ